MNPWATVERFPVLAGQSSATPSQSVLQLEEAKIIGTDAC